MGGTPQIQLDQSTFMPLNMPSQSPGAGSSSANTAGPDYSHIQLDQSTFSPIGGNHLADQDSNVRAGVGERVWNAGKEELGSVARGVAAPVKAVASPPEDATEHVVNSVGGPAGLAAYRASKAVVDAVENTIKSKKEGFQQGVMDLQNALNEFHNKDYRHALADTGSVAASYMSPVNPGVEMGRARDIIQGTKPGGDMATPITKDVVDLGATAALEKGGGLVSSGKLGEAVSPKAEVAGEEFKTRPTFSGANKEAGQQAVQNVARDVTRNYSPETEQASNAPKSIRDVFEQPKEAIRAQAKDLYKQIDDATGGKFSGNERQMMNVTKKLRMAGSDEEVSDLEAQRAQLRARQEQMFDEAKKNGVTDETVNQAKTLWRRQSLADDLSTDFQKSTTGPRPEMRVEGVKGLPEEQYNYKTLAKRINAWDPNDLADALGGSKERAQQLTTAINLAAKEGWSGAVFRASMRVVLGKMGLGIVSHAL